MIETPPTTHLTPRQVEILRLVAQGHSNVEIAEHLAISLDTAKRHIDTVIRVLKLHNRTLLAVYALKRGIISLDEITLPGLPDELKIIPESRMRGRKRTSSMMANMAEKNEIIVRQGDLLREWRALMDELYNGKLINDVQCELWEVRYTDVQKRSRQALGEEPPDE